MGIGDLLDRRPAELSGGQQQRTAIARALARPVDVLLLDEPLANLDFKLREQLRRDLKACSADSPGVVLYSTADPAEALTFAGARRWSLGEGGCWTWDVADMYARAADAAVGDAQRSAAEPACPAWSARAGSMPRAPPFPAAGRATRDGRRSSSRVRPHQVTLERAGRTCWSSRRRSARGGDGSPTLSCICCWPAVGTWSRTWRGRGSSTPRPAGAVAYVDPGTPSSSTRSAAAAATSAARGRPAWLTSGSRAWATATTAAGRWALRPMTWTWRDGRAYALLGPSGLRQDDAAEHHLRAALAHGGAHLVRRPRGDRRADRGAQHRAGLPVPGAVRGDVRLRQPGLPAAQPPRVPRPRSTSGCAEVSQLLGLDDHLGAGRGGWTRAGSRSSAWAAAWCARTWPRCCSTSRSPSSTRR